MSAASKVVRISFKLSDLVPVEERLRIMATAMEQAAVGGELTVELGRAELRWLGEQLGAWSLEVGELQRQLRSCSCMGRD